MTENMTETNETQTENQKNQKSESQKAGTQAFNDVMPEPNAAGTPSTAVVETSAGLHEEYERLRAERDGYWFETDRLYLEGKYLEAIKAAQAMLDVETRWLGDESSDAVGSRIYLADLYAAAEDWPAAEARLHEAIAIRERQYGPTGYWTNDVRADLEYLAGWTLWRDVRIIVSTFKVLVHERAF